MVKTATAWLKRVQQNEKFRLTAKLWRGFTHHRNAAAADEKEFKEGVAPLLPLVLSEIREITFISEPTLVCVQNRETIKKAPQTAIASSSKAIGRSFPMMVASRVRSS